MKKKHIRALKICIIIIVILYVLVALKLIFMIKEIITTGNFNDTNANNAFVILFILLIFMLFIRGMIKTYREGKRINKFIDEGYRICAQLDRISAALEEYEEYDFETSYTVMHYYYSVVLYCSYTATDGRPYSFVSETFTSKYKPQISDKMVSVYIDRNDSAKYYVDIEEFRKRNNF